MSMGIALLVSADPVTIRQFSEALQKLSIAPDVCQEVPEAIALLNRRKFDAVIVDLQLGAPFGKLLEDLRLTPSNRTAVTFAIGGDDLSTATFRMKSAFFFDRPLSTESIRHTLKPAYGLMLRERRRYFRCPVSVPVVIRRKSMPEVRCTSINISEGGLALSTTVPFAPGEEVRVEFTLPGHDSWYAESTIPWSKTGQIGIRFLSLSDESKSELQVWLSRKLEETLPNSVSRQFEKKDAERVADSETEE
jgi:ActR/RegA family two-component response regulator